jgi:hypothetical protein
LGNQIEGEGEIGQDFEPGRNPFLYDDAIEYYQDQQEIKERGYSEESAKIELEEHPFLVGLVVQR